MRNADEQKLNGLTRKQEKKALTDGELTIVRRLLAKKKIERGSKPLAKKN